MSSQHSLDSETLLHTKDLCSGHYTACHKMSWKHTKTRSFYEPFGAQCAASSIICPAVSNSMDKRRGAAVLLVSYVALLYGLFSLTERFNGVEIKDMKIMVQNLPRVTNTQRILEAEWISYYK